MDDDSEFSPTVALLTLARRAELRMAGILEPHGLTLRKYGILQRIAAGHGVTHGELARAAALDPVGMPALLRPLVAAELVRAAQRASGHAELLTITPAGSRLLDDLHAAVRDVDAELFSGEDGERLARALAASAAEPERPPQD